MGQGIQVHHCEDDNSERKYFLCGVHCLQVTTKNTETPETSTSTIILLTKLYHTPLPGDRGGGLSKFTCASEGVRDDKA